MFQKLQIVFCILAALAVACVIPLGGLFGWIYAILAALFAVLFLGLTLLCKQQHASKHPEDSSTVEEKREEPDDEGK